MPRTEWIEDEQGAEAQAELPALTITPEKVCFVIVTAGDVRHAAGPVTDATVAAVLKTAPSVEDLEVAASYLRGEGSQVDRLGHPMSGKVAQLYDILSADALYADDEERETSALRP